MEVFEPALAYDEAEDRRDTALDSVTFHATELLDDPIDSRCSLSGMNSGSETRLRWYEGLFNISVILNIELSPRSVPVVDSILRVQCLPLWSIRVHFVQPAWRKWPVLNGMCLH